MTWLQAKGALLHAAGAEKPSSYHGVCLLSCDASVDVDVTGLHATQALKGLTDHDGAAAQSSTLALRTHKGQSRVACWQ